MLYNEKKRRSVSALAKKAKREKRCELCEFACDIGQEDCVLCRKKGVVRRDHLCRRFTEDWFKLCPTPRPEVHMAPDTDFNDLFR